MIDGRIKLEQHCILVFPLQADTRRMSVHALAMVVSGKSSVAVLQQKYIANGKFGVWVCSAVVAPTDGQYLLP